MRCNSPSGKLLCTSGDVGTHDDYKFYSSAFRQIMMYLDKCVAYTMGGVGVLFHTIDFETHASTVVSISISKLIIAHGFPASSLKPRIKTVY